MNCDLPKTFRVSWKYIIIIIIISLSLSLSLLLSLFLLSPVAVTLFQPLSTFASWLSLWIVNDLDGVSYPFPFSPTYPPHIGVVAARVGRWSGRPGAGAAFIRLTSKGVPKIAEYK